MQFTTLSMAVFAGLAAANYHHPQHFHHRRQMNSTAPLTTLTVFATHVHTVTSCAASITNCPARTGTESAGAVVTEIITIATVS